MDEEEVKEWYSYKHTPTGSTVTVTLVQGNLASKWTEKAFEPDLKKALSNARNKAYEKLGQMRAVLQEILSEAA